MKYEVIWLPEAENELAKIWLDSHRRDAITKASAELDRRLETDAHEVGESREGNRRIAIEQPLSISFRADAKMRIAVVVQVWEFRSR